MSKDQAEIKHARKPARKGKVERRAEIQALAGRAQERKDEALRLARERPGRGQGRRTKADRQPSMAGVVPLGRDHQFLRR